MLTLILGDDKNSGFNFLKSIKNNYSQDSIHEFDGVEDSFVFENVIDAIYSKGMFSTKKLIVLKAYKQEHINFSDKVASEIVNDTDIEFIIIDGGINKNTKAFKNIKKHAIVKEFLKPKDYSNFNFSDAIFIDGDRKKALELLNNMTNIEDEFPLIISSLHLGLRNYVSFRSKNKSSEKTHQFIKRKLQNSKFRANADEAKNMYLSLFDLDVKTKSLMTERRRLLQDFVLYSI